VDDRLGPVTLGWCPVDDQQQSRGDVEAGFLGDLAAAALMRRLTVLEDAAGERPVVAVVRLDQQDLADPVGEQRGRGAEHGRQPGVPPRS
jgi:hypothetical protein